MSKLQSILEKLTRKEAGLFIQFIKYGLAGITATGVQAAIFYLFAWLIFPALSSDDPAVKLTGISVPHLTDALRARNAMIDNAVAFIFSNLTAYLINIAWVFESGRHHRVIEIGMFYIVSGASFAIGTGLMWILINWFSISTTAAFVAMIVVSLLVNYIMRKYVIFKG